MASQNDSEDMQQQQGKLTTAKKHHHKGGRGAAGGGSSGGGNPWSILTILGKSIGSMKAGGPVKRTGLALLHKGEFVVPAQKRSGKRRRKAVARKA